MIIREGQSDVSQTAAKLALLLLIFQWINLGITYCNLGALCVCEAHGLGLFLAKDTCLSPRIFIFNGDHKHAFLLDATQLSLWLPLKDIIIALPYLLLSCD